MNKKDFKMGMAAKLSRVSIHSLQDCYALLRLLNWNRERADWVIFCSAKLAVDPLVFMRALQKMGIKTSEMGGGMAR